VAATLQSALGSDNLAEATLDAWWYFVDSLSFKDVGPFIGQTSAAFVKAWPDLSKTAQDRVVQIMQYLADNSSNFGDHVQDVADFSGIPELDNVQKWINKIRQTEFFSSRLDKLSLRIVNENEAVSVQALRETRALFTAEREKLQALSVGDAFNPAVGRMVQALIRTAVRARDSSDETSGLAFDCVGALGAIDPDRLEMPHDDSTYTLMSNFSDHEDSVQFALYLIEHVLVGAYRSSNDTAHQTALAFAIQELVKFCGFDTNLLSATSGGSKGIDKKIYKRWERLPKVVIETIVPFLASRFALHKKDPVALAGPIYPTVTTYRAWISTWAMSLIDRTSGTAATIFGAFRMVMRHRDVGVAQRLLPHLILNALLSFDDDGRTGVLKEMRSVLEDQLRKEFNFTSEARLLCAQVSKSPRLMPLTSLNLMNFLDYL
jgi:serine/threonine-protein kinase ATR